MTVYVALLRGINVGGKNIIKMQDLKKALEAIGLCEVQTYIQSGNVLFKSDKDAETLRQLIEARIEAVFSISAAVILRTSDELEFIFGNCPFSSEEIAQAELAIDAECLYVSLLARAPAQEKLKRLDTYADLNNQYCLIGRDVYLFLKDSIRNSKLANNVQKLDSPSTIRNWKTIGKLVEMAKG